MRRINRCLNRQLVTICQQVMQLDNLNSKLKQLLPPHLEPHCHVGSFNQGCLLLITYNAAWATELRYCLPTLRDSLRKEAKLYQLTSIKIQIVESQETKAPDKPIKGQIMSTKVRTIIRDTGDLCHYSPLKEALYRLANPLD